MQWYVIVLLFLVVITASGGSGFFYKKLISFNEGGNDIPLILTVVPVPLCLLFCILASIAGWEFTAVNLICGAAGGICFCGAVSMLLSAVSKGDYSVSIIIVNLSFFIPILLSAIFLSEKISVLQIIGIVVLFFVIVFSNIRIGGKKQAEDEVKPRSNLWILYALLACLCNGLVNFCLKVQQHYSPSSGQDSFYFIMYAVSLAIGLLLLVCTRGAAVKRAHPFRIPLASLGLSVCVALAYYPVSYLAGSVNAALLFGVSTAGSVLVGLLGGRIFFKEKITVRTIVSIVCCIAALLLQVVPV